MFCNEAHAVLHNACNMKTFNTLCRSCLSWHCAIAVSLTRTSSSQMPPSQQQGSDAMLGEMMSMLSEFLTKVQVGHQRVPLRCGGRQVGNQGHPIRETSHFCDVERYRVPLSFCPSLSDEDLSHDNVQEK